MGEKIFQNHLIPGFFLFFGKSRVDHVGFGRKLRTDVCGAVHFFYKAVKVFGVVINKFNFDIKELSNQVLHVAITDLHFFFTGNGIVVFHFHAVGIGKGKRDIPF